MSLFVTFRVPGANPVQHPTWHVKFLEIQGLTGGVGDFSIAVLGRVDCNHFEAASEVRPVCLNLLGADCLF